ncbi:MAG: GNAT family N-acetyltransferase [Alphaproteobacteria bacterium]|nr:GNAT family N-acetyltransferase [Alphaproteobacteria bacterium]
MIGIRPGRPSDTEALLDLWEALMDCGTAADPRFRRSSDARPHMRTYMESWFAPQPFETVWIADDAGQPVGMVRGFPNLVVPVVDREPTMRIGDLYVRDSHRRQGIARRLVEALLASARGGGYPRTEVGTLTADTRAVAFWKSMGFTDWQVLLARD